MQTTFIIVGNDMVLETIHADYLNGEHEEVWDRAYEIAQSNPGDVLGVYKICYWVEQETEKDEPEIIPNEVEG